MSGVKIERLPFVDPGPMILSVSFGFYHRVVMLCALALGVVLGARPVAAQDNGWFEGAPPGGVTSTQQVTTSRGPAPAGQAMEPLAESPLLEEGGAASDVDRDPRALTAWSQELAPYGVWVDDPSYGRVWIPSPEIVGPGFSPYVTNGRWALDESNEWIWVSEYPFGRVVFHYGRWVWISGRGWAWVPGLQYAPAWVTWRVPVDSYAYVGWAPIPPSYVWFGGIAVWWGYPLYYPWVFCPSAYVFSPYVHHHIVHDHHGQAHAAHYTRPYYPPRGYVRQPPRGPAPSAANVPPDSVPRQRVSSRQIAASPQASLGIAGPGVKRQAAPRTQLSSVPSDKRPANLSGASGASRSVPSLESTSQSRRSSVVKDRSELSRPSFSRPSPTRSVPRLEPMRSPMRSTPRFSPGSMRAPRR
jgi:hypothetical protein